MIIWKQGKKTCQKGGCSPEGYGNLCNNSIYSGWFIRSSYLRKIADVVEKYQVKIIKMNSEHRIGLYGINGMDIEAIFDDLEIKPGGFIGNCVRGVKFCTGNTSRKKGHQNTVEMGLRIDNTFHRMETPKKVKISLSGCTSSYAIECQGYRTHRNT